MADKPKKKMPKGKPFKKGQSGNPKGRPPRAKLIPDMLRAIGEEEVEASDGSGEKKTKLQIVLDKIYQKASKGDLACAQFIADRTEGKALQTIEQRNLSLKDMTDAEIEEFLANTGD